MSTPNSHPVRVELSGYVAFSLAVCSLMNDGSWSDVWKQSVMERKVLWCALRSYSCARCCRRQHTVMHKMQSNWAD